MPKGKTKYVKVSDWLARNSDSHAIQDHVKLGARFTVETGKPADWPVHTIKETRTLIEGDPRSGMLRGDDKTLVCYGYEMAEHLADLYGSDKERGYREMMGRGFRYRAAIASLKAAGN